MIDVLLPVLLGYTEATDWQESALCAQSDPDEWFQEKGGSTKTAKSVCHDCPVKADCLEYALANDERFGVWGGLSAIERRRLVRARNTTTERQVA